MPAQSGGVPPMWSAWALCGHLPLEAEVWATRRPSWRPRRVWGCPGASWRRGPGAGPEDGERWEGEQPWGDPEAG